jgi:ubiquitin carboxyl-terminal hydrolase 36/42
MNDEMVSPLNGPPVSKKTAYILFYIRDKGQGLQAVIKGNEVNGVYKEKEKEGGGGLLAGMKKRRERDEDVVTNRAEEEDLGEKVGSPPAKFIGPLLPSPMDRSSGSPTKKVKTNHNFASAEDVKEEKKTDPQADKVKRKIEAAKASKEAKARSALALLEGYDSSDEGSDRDENVIVNGKSKRVAKARVLVESDDEGEAVGDKGEDQESKPPSSPISQFSGTQVSSPISTNNFYGPTQPLGKKGFVPHVNGKMSSVPSKSRSSDDEDKPSPDKGSRRYQDRNHQKHRVSVGSSGKKHSREVINPYSQIGSGNGGGRMNTYGKRNQWKKPRARGL